MTVHDEKVCIHKKISVKYSDRTPVKTTQSNNPVHLDLAKKKKKTISSQGNHDGFRTIVFQKAMKFKQQASLFLLFSFLLIFFPF